MDTMEYRELASSFQENNADTSDSAQVMDAVVFPDSGDLLLSEHHKQLFNKITVWKFNIPDCTGSRLMPPNAPPPKLHFKTFWRSLSRRVCHGDVEEIKESVRRTKISL